MHNPDVLEKAGKKVVLLGNEAIVRGALEAGLGFSAAYPGTPSSEVGMTLASIAKEAGIYFEWSSNEKVAFEAAAGAAYCGVRSMTAMKHFGFNVASDSIFPIIYTGVRGGMVIMVADDPHGLSSAQSEQDSRWYSRLGNIPTIEPSNAQECKDYTKIAFEISEKHQIPVMLRTTTRISHSIGTVLLGEIAKPKTKGKFVKDPDRYFNIGPALLKLHKRALEKLEKIGKEYSGKLNSVEGDGDVGIITSGVSYQYLRELELKDVKLARLGLTHPISRKFVSNFIKGLKTVIVIEELDPFIEGVVREVAKDANPGLRIYGKDILPREGEYSTELIYGRIAPLLGLPKKDFSLQDRELGKIKVPTRKPVLCQGCPHRSTFYAAKKALGEETVWAGDVGCYAMGVYEPIEMQDFIISMGASLGIAHGMKKVSDQKVALFIGDSTFFHASMPGIVNLKYNDPKPIVIVLDNAITAMTGHQPNAGSGMTAMGEARAPIRIEDVVKSFGIDVKIVNAYNQKELQDAIRELDKKGELGVIISRGMCRLLMKRNLRREGKEFIPFAIDPAKCIKCRICSDEYACPAIFREGDKFWIDPEVCWGCSVCAQICPVKAISAVRK